MASAQSKNHKEYILNVPVRIDAKFVANRCFPFKKAPELIGFYSINEEREFVDSDEQLPYFHEPINLPLDLNAGIEHVRRKKPDPPFHDILFLCKYIYEHQYLVHATNSGCLSLGVDFLTLRGILRKLMCSPYEYSQDYRLMATRLNGTIYMSKVETEQEANDRMNSSPYQLSMASWGFKFEQYCMSNSPNEKPDTSKPVNENAEFDCLFRNSLNNISIMFGAEMDGICSSTVVDLSSKEAKESVEFIELKTTTCEMSPNQIRIFNDRKSLNWWSQSSLVGVNRIVAGLRTREGMAVQIKSFNVNDLPQNKRWSAKVAAVFLELFLQEVKLLMEQVNDPHAVVQLDFRPKESCITYQVLTGPDAPKVIPDWFRTFMRGSATS